MKRHGSLDSNLDTQLLGSQHMKESPQGRLSNHDDLPNVKQAPDSRGTSAAMIHRDFDMEHASAKQLGPKRGHSQSKGVTILHLRTFQIDDMKVEVGSSTSEDKEDVEGEDGNSGQAHTLADERIQDFVRDRKSPAPYKGNARPICIKCRERKMVEEIAKFDEDFESGSGGQGKRYTIIPKGHDVSDKE